MKRIRTIKTIIFLIGFDLLRALVEAYISSNDKESVYDYGDGMSYRLWIHPSDKRLTC